MDSAAGVPKELASRERNELTPMIAQYVDLCEEYESELLLFHVGDFYKAFGEAAETVARLCELTLTTREDTSGEYKMAGLRVENAETHLQTLLDAGYRIAIAEQVEDPETVSGVAERAVTHVITPGTLTESELLNPVEPNYVMSLTQTSSETSVAYGLAFLDVSTGAFHTTSLASVQDLADEVSRVSPVEVILGPEIRVDSSVIDTVLGPVDCEITEHDAGAFQESRVRAKVAEYFGQLQGSTAPVSEVRASGALLDYAEYTRGGIDGSLDHITHLTRYNPAEYMQLDDVALRGLELFDRRAEQSPEGATLIDVLDDCVSALGSRELRDWIRRPLISQSRIETRYDAVEELITREFTRAELRDLLKHVYDIERLSSKISRGRADARDIRSLYQTLVVLPDLRAELAECESELLTSLRDQLPDLAKVRDVIDAAISEDPPAELTDGGIIREGYDTELDELRRTVRENEAWIDGLEETERERTGIDNLRVGHTEVHGYYIEVTNSNLDKVPEDYTRRQTLKNSERFYTPELQEREEEIIAAEQRAHDLEYELFVELREELAEETHKFQSLATHIARLDVLCTFAKHAAYNEYSRPQIASAGSGIQIQGGRHPVVEQTQDSFVPNDTRLDRDSYLAVITGPNMSGKSTYLRQVALITILAQCGSFIPAESARIGITDRIYTRIGASDDITGGQSTFMVEMTEMANILENASEHSLVILDEVGRGTSTADGFALACAITRYIHEQIGAKTLFATHHHELTEFISEFPHARNLHFSAEQEADNVIFHYTIADGAATASYGVNVAKEAGVPDQVIQDARNLLTADGRHEREVTSHTDTSGPSQDTGSVLTDELATLLEEYSEDSIIEAIHELEAVTIADYTPLEALQLLDDLQEKLDSS